MKTLKFIFILTLFLLLSVRISQAQEKVYLPLILKDGKQIMEYAILAISNGTETVNFLDLDSGIQLREPYWTPQNPGLKGGGTFVNPSNADGQALVEAHYDNVNETIPLQITGKNGYKTVERVRRLFQLETNAQGFYTASFELNQVYFIVKPKGNNFLTGYSSIYVMTLPNLENPFGTPFTNDIDRSGFVDLNLVLNREPFFSPVVPGEIIGPLFNLVKNPDYELWNFGINDSQPDSWDDLEMAGITGTNSRYSTPKWGNYALQVSVTGSTVTGKAKGVTQNLENTKNNTEYTVVAWVKNDGITKGTGRILINYSDQLELYNSATKHNWTLYTGKITTGINDVVSIDCEILSTDTNTVGNVYFDGLMLIEGDYLQYASDNLLAYMTGSHIQNYESQKENFRIASAINYVDMWNIPGDVDSNIRLDFMNITTPTDENNPVEIFSKVRIGLRRTGDVFEFDNVFDPVGIEDTNATGDSCQVLADLTTPTIEKVGTKTIQGVSKTTHNQGRFKVFARLLDSKSASPSTVEIYLTYNVGTSDVNTIVQRRVTPSIVQNYTIVDLTEDDFVNLDFKFNSNQLRAIIYQLFATRTTGTDDLKFDYFLVMPTDGGYLETSLNPPLPYKNSLIVDTTGNKISVDIVGAITGYKELGTFGDTVTALGTFNDLLYISEGNYVWGYKDNNISLIWDGTPTGASGMIFAEYNGKFYYTDGNDIWETDGLNFPGDLVVTLLGGVTFIYDLLAFDGRLWMVDNQGQLSSWDGTDVVSYDTLQTTARDIEIYANELYVATANNARVYRFNTSTNTLSLAYTVPAGAVVEHLKTFDEKLYITVNNGDMWTYDGNTWTQVTLDFVPGDMEVLNDVLYIVGTIIPDTFIYYTVDGMNWFIIYDTESRLGWRLKSFQGNLYIGTVDDPPIEASLLSIIFDTDFYSIGEFSGTGFSAPNRTKNSDSRHRYIFSYDREGYKNVIDDSALVGVGYRPRYKSLINKDDF